MTKVNASTGAVAGTFPVGKQPRAVTFDGANIWVASSGGDTVKKLSAATGALLNTYRMGAQPERACVRRHLPCGCLISSQNRLKRINTNGVAPEQHADRTGRR